MRISDWSSDVCSSDLSGLSPRHSTPGAAVTDTKSLPKNTPVTSPSPNSASASGEASPSSGLAKSRVPASVTDRKSVGWGKGEAVRVDRAGRRHIKTTNHTDVHYA